MSDYYDALIAAGFSQEQAERDSYANEIQMWRNREHPAYGKELGDDDR